MKKPQEKLLQIFLIVATFVMIILRFLLNEKGRTNPDSIRFMRTADAFPVIDNTTTPLGYPLSLKFFTMFGLGEFWGSKILGIAACFFMIWFAAKKKFYFKETLLICGLFSYVSIFSYTMSEPLILPFVFLFLYISRKIILGNLEKTKAVFYLSLILILLFNIRYSALFFIGGCFVYGVLSFKKRYSKIFIASSLVGLCFIVLYKFLFIDYFNENYVNQFLEIGLHSTPKLLVELFQGLATSFNPFIHIADPAGRSINYAIYGIGALNIILMIFIFAKNGLSETERFFVFMGVFGIVCSYFIQYVYSVNAMDYRLLSPFILLIWMVYFKKLLQIFGKYTYAVTLLSLAVGFAFTWLSKGNYLENRKQISQFLKTEHLEKASLKFYIDEEKNQEIIKQNLDKVQVAELISTVNPRVKITFQPKDTLQKTTLTEYKVSSKIKISKNKYQ
ncbi:MAG: hypothetical protein LBE36_12505 [Flavobacteriaceae bacterium]|jgi:hypothetical protein|nr:hypothetical protein [Flavobacteriaceae bacterium]